MNEAGGPVEEDRAREADRAAGAGRAGQGGDAGAARVRVLIADDHAAIRAGLRLLLEAHGFEVVGEAADGASAVGNARALRPDVVLMDVRMPGTDGIEATRTIVSDALSEVLVLTTFDLDEYVFGAVRAGAAGFLLKSTTGAALQAAVEAVARGDGALSPEVTRRLLDRFAETRDPLVAEPPAVAGIEHLTSREREVLAALGEGLSNVGIGQRMHISASTAKTHVSRVLAKLGVASRMEAAVLARRAGLTD
ncbi:response regulator [Pseudoclavibacter terrae]|uniref:Response regulator transcription factor n=1 Tax=Pseudoclavibacter terrae TaxID=1530195 RepID=A0A7J5B2E7_9MICO|nr:response regulator transcription factor [Pseudoclavibacter terrae]KAB1638200.1 response regulator transcription factor [Pseudoclavibacter terrae]